MKKEKSEIILLSIHPQHVKKILSGIKYFEYRKVIPRKFKKIVIYSTSPVQRVVAVVAVEEILSDEPAQLWKKTKEGAGISRTYFNQYFKGRTLGSAIKLGEIQQLAEPIPLCHEKLQMTAPQSFTYFDEANLISLLYK